MSHRVEECIREAADAVLDCQALLITAGAGMGVDSGLPDFRGDEGFWRAYPPMKKIGVSFVDMANPAWFDRDPSLAWGFYGHRLNLYRDTRPHDGFRILHRWCRTKPAGAFIFTSNVDGHFQRAGFNASRVLECHGSIHHLQCSSACQSEIWDADDCTVTVDHETFRAAPPYPQCPNCGAVARPNVLMFGDWSWVPHRSHDQESRFSSWLRATDGLQTTVVELGAGTAVPTVRLTSEDVARRPRTTLVRINPREAHGPPGVIGIPTGAFDALRRIDDELSL